MQIFFDLPKALEVVFSSGLVWHELLHVIIPIPLALYLYKQTKKISLVIILFLVAIFLDLDHLVDYFIFYRANIFRLSDFFKAEYFILGKDINWAMVPFHSWEWLVLLIFINIKKNSKSIWRAVLFGYSAHILLDFVSVGSFTLYLLTYRILILMKLFS